MERNTMNETREKRDPTCYGRVVTRTAAQEHYETASRDAGRRARELRNLGYRVSVDALGPQVTPVGTIKMTMVTVYHDGVELPPEPARMVQP